MLPAAERLIVFSDLYFRMTAPYAGSVSVPSCQEAARVPVSSSPASFKSPLSLSADICDRSTVRSSFVQLNTTITEESCQLLRSTHTASSDRFSRNSAVPCEILKQTDCESIAADLSQIGYGTHVVHNNTATFYSRNNAFSMMGFDTFTSKECMNISQYTPNGNWPTDDVLVQETVKAMNATENQSDFVYTITVEGHGDYPTEKVLENPDILVSGAADEASNNQWEYYVNMIHEVDDFIGDLITAVDRRGEDTIIVFFGDHLPTMGLTDADMKSGDIFKTKYITWNNMGLAKKDADLTAYQLLAHITDQAGIHEGTMFRYHQTQTASETYLSGLEDLQYDLLYGKRYSYGGEDRFPASDLVMDVEDANSSAII